MKTYQSPKDLIELIIKNKAYKTLNLFHLLIRVKSEKEIGIYKNLNSDGSKDYVRFQTKQDENLSVSEGPDRVDIKRPSPTKHLITFIH